MIETERPTYTATGVRSGGTILTLEKDSIMSAETTTSINRPSTGSFTVANINDKFYRKARAVNPSGERQLAVVDYMTEALKVSEVIERNVERREEYFRRVNDGTLPVNLSNFVEELPNGKIISANAPLSLTREEAYSLYEHFAPDFQLMNRVWIDFRDRNGDWAPGFTGFLSMVQKVRIPGQNSTLTMTCKGMTAMLQRSEIVIAKAVDQKMEPTSKEEAALIDQSPFTNAFSGLTGEEIIRRVLSYARDIYCFNSGDISLKDSTDFFHQDKLWRLTDDPEIDGATQTGITSDTGWGDLGHDVRPLREFIAGTTTTQDRTMTGKLIIDPSILENALGQRDIFNKVIRQSFQIYQNTNQFAYNLIREVVDLMGYDFFDDPRGNLVFQPPGYDKLPRFRGDIQGLDADVTKFGEDYSEIPYHARDYILDHIGDKGLREVETEDGIVTLVTGRGGVHFIPTSGQDMEFIAFTGTTSPTMLREQINEEISDRVLRLNKRFGVRRQVLRQLITGFGSTNYLTRYAYANLVQMNAGAKSGSISLHHRPDIWPGRSVYLVEAQKVGYVVGTSNSFNKSGRSTHSTTLTLAYMHHPSEKIGVPWLINTDSAAAKAPIVPQDPLYDAETVEAIVKL